jgi:hypothetical protein
VGARRSVQPERGRENACVGLGRQHSGLYMKQYAILLDDRSDESLGRVSAILDLSRSDVVRRLVVLADAAVFWGVQLHLSKDLTAEEKRVLARSGLREWGLLTLSEEPFDPVRMAKVGPGPRLVRDGAE